MASQLTSSTFDMVLSEAVKLHRISVPVAVETFSERLN